MFWRTSKKSSAKFWTYGDIPLRVYLHIAKTGDVNSLLLEGTAGPGECVEKWEEIVKAQEKVSGSNKYNQYMQLVRAYSLFINDYTVIRATLIYLNLRGWVGVEVGHVAYIRTKGYAIALDTEENFYNSLKLSLQRCENLITKAVSKSKDIERLLESKGTKQAEESFESLIANLTYALKFAVDDNITLARYNEYQRVLRAQAKEMEKQNAKRNGRRRTG